MFNVKSTLEKVHGRELSMDEFIHLWATQYTDLPAERDVIVRVQQWAKDLEKMLLENRETQAAACVQFFADALCAVIKGDLKSSHLADALIEVE